jgi:hypothetical protein
MLPLDSELEALLAACFMLVSVLAFSLTLKMKATRTSETLIAFQQTTWRYIPEGRTLQQL